MIDQWYMITISPIRKGYYTDDDILEVVDSLKKRIRRADWSCVQSFEIDKRKCLHYHGIFRRNGKLTGKYIKDLQHPVYRIHFTELDPCTLDNVFRYITKYACNFWEQNQILIQNYYNHHYSFLLPLEASASKAPPAEKGAGGDMSESVNRFKIDCSEW